MVALYHTDTDFSGDYVFNNCISIVEGSEE